MSAVNLLEVLVKDIKALFNHEEFVTAAPYIIEAGNAVASVMQATGSAPAAILGQVVSAAVNIAQSQLAAASANPVVAPVAPAVAVNPGSAVPAAPVD